MKSYRQHLVVGLSALALCGSAMAGLTVDVDVSGSVQQATSITIKNGTVSPVAESNLLVSGTGVAIATMNEKCNKINGYTVTVQSATASAANSSQARMKGLTPGNTDVVNYVIKYDGTTVTLDNTGKATVTNSSVKTGGQGIDKALTIDTTGDANLAADTYKDTLTFTIAAK